MDNVPPGARDALCTGVWTPRSQPGLARRGL